MIFQSLLLAVLAQAPTCGPSVNCVPAPIVQAIVLARQEHKAGWVHTAIAAQAMAQIADGVSTSYAIGRGAHETNRAVAPFAGSPIRLAILKTSVAGASTYLLYRLHHQHPKAAFVIGAVSAGTIGAIAVRNYHVGRSISTR